MGGSHLTQSSKRLPAGPTRSIQALSWCAFLLVDNEIESGFLRCVDHICQYSVDFIPNCYLVGLTRPSSAICISSLSDISSLRKTFANWTATSANGLLQFFRPFCWAKKTEQLLHATINSSGRRSFSPNLLASLAGLSLRFMPVNAASCVWYAGPSPHHTGGVVSGLFPRHSQVCC